jgi:diguanylate cyclase (GGDEF)-like protein
MSTREEASAGFQVLTDILKEAGLRLKKSSRPWKDLTLTHVELGTDDQSTDIVLSDEFLSGLPNRPEYHTEAESYAASIAGRIKCGPPNTFYCRSGIPTDLQIHWPIRESFTQEKGLVNWLMVAATNEIAGTSAMCSLQFGAFEYPSPSPFQRAEQIANRMRDAIDEGTVQFVPDGARSSRGPIIEQKLTAENRNASDQEIERFLVGKAYDLGFRAAHSPRPTWVPDPWDADYLGTTTRALSQAAHILQAKGLLTISGHYASPSDKLLSEGLSAIREEQRSPQEFSLSTLPNKEKFETHVTHRLKEGLETALIFIDLDNFKSVNDTQGHQAGNACLERAIQAMGAAIGSKGVLYRWGGDEFVVCLPDFSTEEATATAERIRRAIEKSKAGGAIAVTASVGVCATDQITTTTPAEFIEGADQAMYSSKKGGKNRVTVAYKTGHRTIAQRRPL